MVVVKCSLRSTVRRQWDDSFQLTFTTAELLEKEVSVVVAVVVVVVAQQSPKTINRSIR